MNWILPLMVALPLLAAVPAFAVSRKKAEAGILLMAGVSVLVCALAAVLFATGQTYTFATARVLNMGIRLKADGFRALYALIAAFMWMMTSLFSPQYFNHGHAKGRYALFTLLTLGATLGVFLSDDLITTFLFFEILSFTSYCWVIHEQTPGAMRAGQTYLAIAILGGMTMLMGLMMLYQRTGTLQFEGIQAAIATMDVADLYLPGSLILAGFGAKAGMVPLHVWLPKAHPVAPAPASALLSGVLTKVGIFGILVISTRMFAGDVLWGQLLLGIGLINMLLGAVLALFSIDLKRTLACSSMSQIGFILFGIGMQDLLGEHNALAAQGTVLHMLNHSMIKLVLFMAAGVVYLNVHKLDLNEVKGYGRKKPGLMLIFLVGAASISGIPFFSGYASKTLLHESIVEYIVHLQELGHSALPYQIAEWLFVITGGLTFCYMLKLFFALFIQKNDKNQEAFDRMGPSMRPLSGLALGGSALVLFVLGLYPEGILTTLANGALPFLKAHEPAHAVHYLAGVNLMGGGKSLLLGVILYVTVVRLWLTVKNEQGQAVYVNRWPQWLDIEDGLYRPLVNRLVKLGYFVATPLDLLFEKVYFAFSAVLTFIARLLEISMDGVSLLLMRTVLKTRTGPSVVPVGNRFTYTLGRFADKVSAAWRRAFGLSPREPYHYVMMYAAMWTTFQDTARRMLRTLSFGLILFALGVVALLAFLILKK